MFPMAPAGSPASAPQEKPRSGRGPRSSRWFIGGLAAFLLLTFLIGAVVGRNFLSPAQRAAQAAPPKPSVIVAPVKEGVLAVNIVLRADVIDARPVTIGAPAEIDAGSAVVTGMHVRRGSAVRAGDLVMEVSARPVFLLAGRIPAFRDMVPGTVGIDVEQLQRGLRSLGYQIGFDRLGSYGAGTESAVRAFYRSSKAPLALTTPGADSLRARLRSTVTSAVHKQEKARQRLAEDIEAEADSAILADDRADVTAARKRLSSAKKELSQALATTGATVPRGEIVFAPQLPAKVITVRARLGGKTPRSGVLSIGSGDVRVIGEVDPAILGQLKVGMRAKATSDLLNSSLRLRLVSVGAASGEGAGSGGGDESAGQSEQGGESQSNNGQRGSIALEPVGKIPTGWVGQNVAVRLTTASSGDKVLIVPVSAVSTDGSGRTYVTAAEPTTGKQREVTVTLGLASGGEQAVIPQDTAALKPSDSVVVGQNATGTS